MTVIDGFDLVTRRMVMTEITVSTTPTKEKSHHPPFSFLGFLRFFNNKNTSA